MVSDTTKRKPPSGRFVLRIEPRLHAILRENARAAGLSLNDYCARKLAAPSPDRSMTSGLDRAVERALRLFGENLVVGVAAFGSWARGELTEQSDIDLLVVLAPSVPLNRKLYRSWDEEPLRCAGRPIEAQFVHLPDEQERVAGIWAEVALDGIVLFEREERLSRRLVRTRHEIVSGHIVRRVVHGQPYWVSEVA